MKRIPFFLATILLALSFWAEQTCANEVTLYPEADRLVRESGFFAQCIEPHAALFTQLASFTLALLGIFWFARRQRLRATHTAEHCASKAADFDSKSQQGE